MLFWGGGSREKTFYTVATTKASSNFVGELQPERNHLKEAGLCYRQTIPRDVLTGTHRDTCLAFAIRNLDCDWETVIFSGGGYNFHML